MTSRRYVPLDERGLRIPVENWSEADRLALDAAHEALKTFSKKNEPLMAMDAARRLARDENEEDYDDDENETDVALRWLRKRGATEATLAALRRELDAVQDERDERDGAEAERRGEPVAQQAADARLRRARDLAQMAFDAGDSRALKRFHERHPEFQRRQTAVARKAQAGFAKRFPMTVGIRQA